MLQSHFLRANFGHHPDQWRISQTYRFDPRRSWWFRIRIACFRCLHCWLLVCPILFALIRHANSTIRFQFVSFAMKSHQYCADVSVAAKSHSIRPNQLWADDEMIHNEVIILILWINQFLPFNFGLKITSAIFWLAILFFIQISTASFAYFCENNKNLFKTILCWCRTFFSLFPSGRVWQFIQAKLRTPWSWHNVQWNAGCFQKQ